MKTSYFDGRIEKTFSREGHATQAQRDEMLFQEYTFQNQGFQTIEDKEWQEYQDSIKKEFSREGSATQEQRDAFLNRFSGGGSVTQQQVDAYEAETQWLQAIGGLEDTTVTEEGVRVLEDRRYVIGLGLPERVQINRDARNGLLDTGVIQPLHEVEFVNNTTKYNRDERALVGIYSNKDTQALEKILSEVKKKEWKKWAGDTYRADNPGRFNIRVNPTTGEREMFIGEADWGATDIHQSFVNSQLGDVGSYTGIPKEATQLATSGTATVPQIGTVQVWGGMNPGGNQKLAYAQYLDSIATRLNVDRIYAHSGGAAIAQLMEHPAERIGIDGVMNLNRGDRVSEQREFVNLLSNNSWRVNEALEILAVPTFGATTLAKTDYGDADLVYRYNVNHFWTSSDTIA